MQCPQVVVPGSSHLWFHPPGTSHLLQDAVVPGPGDGGAPLHGHLVPQQQSRRHKEEVLLLRVPDQVPRSPLHEGGRRGTPKFHPRYFLLLCGLGLRSVHEGRDSHSPVGGPALFLPPPTMTGFVSLKIPSGGERPRTPLTDENCGLLSFIHSSGTGHTSTDHNIYT